ncbi:NERD domain-containing protein [Jeotgalibacillus haloalkalitolerans]|uniref:NERD domain-containing protein n=1 Tax=Jeotgalibacillus haloalkalitolerans TaxID=3104292 RepID=A0ABU5KJE9_9BACL|nr:NERD domain-containing protein [Jeotgalibacillus sp. HH7-29]MDZ5711384.1 NERD domain-containing protein [Jeotgalibacillus sp. HH7-29]
MKKIIIITMIVLLALPFLFVFAPWIFTAAMLIGIFFLRTNFPQIKGAAGEWMVNQRLSKLGPEYRTFHDLYVPKADGGTTQVDHIVTSPYGIFVIETKHYDGWIFGSEKQKYWTQTIYKRKEKLYNPIWQNYGHIKAIKHYIDQEKSNHIHSIIAFSQNSTFKFKEEFQSARVIQFPQLLEVIQEHKLAVIDENDLKRINAAFKQLILTDRKQKRHVKKQHVDDIKNPHNTKTQKIKHAPEKPGCPKCGAELSIKRGKHGSFYACTTYPACRFTKRVG